VAWQQLTLSIASNDLPRAEALLGLAGASAVSISDSGEAPILEPEPGTTPLWPDLTLTALFADDVDLAGIGHVLEDLSEGGVRIARMSDEDLERAMRQRVHRIEIGPRLVIVPAEEYVPGDGRELGLHMGLAFGTGQHPTTRLCLEWLEREAGPAGRVLDFGCGTGVLALAALRLGAAHACATDNEIQALVATRENARLNRLEAAIEVCPPEELGADTCDLLLANILAQPLIDLADALAARQPPGGRIVLSGILSAQLDAVESRYALNYEQIERHELEGWGLLTGTRRSGYDR